jgi:hypothetical protein
MKTIKQIVLCFFIVSLLSCTKEEEFEKPITVIDITPQQAKANSQVDVIGSGFLQMVSSDSLKQIKVFIGNTQVQSSIINDSLINIWIPANATSGVVCVEWNGKRYCSEQSFSILPGNTVTNTFMRMPDFPGDFVTGYMFSIGNNIYVSDIENFWKFNIENFQWSKAAKPPERAFNASTFIIDGKAYIFGGLTYSYGNGDNQLWQYNPQLNQWTVKTPMPAAKRYNSNAFVYNNRGYIAGGTVSDYGSTVPYELWEYDPASDNWSQKTDLLGNIEDQSNSYSIGNKHYFQLNHYILEYDPSTSDQRIIYGTIPTKLSAVHSSKRWNFAYVINSGGISNNVQRIALNYNGGLTTQIVKDPIDPIFYPSDPGSKHIQNFTSIGEELFFIIYDFQAKKSEFWSYLPE